MGNKKVLTIIILIIIFAGAFYFYKNNIRADVPIQEETKEQKDISKESPRIISTKPEPLEDNIIAAEEIIEITFNRPLENVGEFKLRIEPKTDHKVELSGDRKTAKIIPVKPYQLGTTYTLFIGPDSKFDGVGNWGQEKIYHFRTIKYTGV